MRLGGGDGVLYDESMPAPLHDLAAKYIWWQTPEVAELQPLRVMAQVMDIGTFADVRTLEETVGSQALVEVIRHAEPGWFSPRSWHFWHRRLGMADSGNVPHLPARCFA